MSDQKSPSDVFAPWETKNEPPLISISSVTKKFGDFTALQDINLDIYSREFFALLGPSGCGKTTLMRMLDGFETPTTGTITIDGQDMKNVPPNKRAVNMMFQSYALFPHLSVWENIAFGLKRDKQTKGFIDTRVDEMLRLTRLENFASRKPHQISGGQRQRVALARSLAKAPKLLLLDEPMGALDKKLRQETQFELMDIQESTGTTFVIVTHDQEEAMTVASRVAVMDHGKLVQVDPPDRIYEAPKNTYVADFIGEVNFIKGAIKKQGDHLELHWAEGTPPIAIDVPSQIDASKDYTLAVRPEKISISKEKPAADKNAVDGKILDIAYTGSMSTFKVELKGGQILKSQVANTKRISKRDFTWEDNVWLSWSKTAGMLLED